MTMIEGKKKKMPMIEGTTIPAEANEQVEDMGVVVDDGAGLHEAVELRLRLRSAV